MKDCMVRGVEGASLINTYFCNVSKRLGEAFGPQPCTNSNAYSTSENVFNGFIDNFPDSLAPDVVRKYIL